MTRLRRTSEGYVALMAVLIVGAAATAVATALLVSGADNQRAALITQQSTQARSLATACAEEAMQTIHDTTTFTGTNSLSLGQGSCSYTVTNTGGSNRTITTSGTVNSIVRKLQIYVTITTSISITSWQEVS